MTYSRTPYCIGEGRTVLSCGRTAPQPVAVKPDLPGAVILVHGVNDVGTSYEAVEQGLCEGLSDRLGWQGGRAPFVPARYRGYDPVKDAEQLHDDPDAVFYRRQIEAETHSGVIPFYWGFREDGNAGARTVNGQKVDRFGNRLDKDFSKGGGPFANATSTLADMWNSGAPRLLGVPDWLAADPLRPVLEAPGRMYMVLAARRLANLIEMILAYDPAEVVSVVAHSQGCLISLLAQAFLMERCQRPADTLVLTHPPYSLTENIAEAAGLCHGGGEDASMRGHYHRLSGQQTLKARLDTLVNIVHGVAAYQKAGWSEEELRQMRATGVHSARWEASGDRDNRGKVYLYFCPEDMTVALPNVQGIGWQGVPYRALGSRALDPGEDAEYERTAAPAMRPLVREPLKELGPRFLQRVFTGKVRPSGSGRREAFKVGLPPQDFVLREEGEDDHGHVAPKAASHRADLPETDREGRHPFGLRRSEEARRRGLRHISAEALATPVTAEMHAGALPGTRPVGAFESVDAIDAAIAVTSRYGLRTLPPEDIEDPCPDSPWRRSVPAGPLPPAALREVEEALNRGRREGERFRLVRGICKPPGRLTIERQETPDEARLRHQHGTSERSFHGAIIGSRHNHAKVTAYDVSVGQGLAVSHPDFYRYLCAVADWRLKKPKPGDQVRSGILTWHDFQKTFALYWSEEDAERRRVIEGSCDYYSEGLLPGWLPDITQRPSAVVCETSLGVRTDTRGQGRPPQRQALTEQERQELGPWAGVRVAGCDEAADAHHDQGPLVS